MDFRCFPIPLSVDTLDTSAPDKLSSAGDGSPDLRTDRRYALHEECAINSITTYINIYIFIFIYKYYIINIYILIWLYHIIYI